MAVYNTTPHHTTPHHTTNFFSPQDHFFIIDSQDLASVKTSIYGFSVQDSGIYDRHNFTDEVINGLDGNGVYVCVERSGDEIVIRQDFSGSYGLYLYKQDGHFVLSNSFLYLMEYLSKRVRLTLNRDYANHFMIMVMVSMAYSETFLNEVEVLPRDVVVKIDIPSVSLTTERVYYHENTVRLNSREGLDILDRWFARWTTLFRNIYSQTHNIDADLSGGFDSRMTFGLLLKSGIDINSICVTTKTGKGHTLEDDYEVASEIAKQLGFALNNRDVFTGGELNSSVEDGIKIAFYARMFVHNQFHRERICCQMYEDKHYKVTGNGGENIRTYWHTGSKSFLTNNLVHARYLSKDVKAEHTASMLRILNNMLETVSRKYNIPVSDALSPYVFRETEERFHVGTATAQDVLINQYTLIPLMDVLLHQLQLYDEKCSDQNLLIAVIYTRYFPELLRFRFTTNKKINPETLAFAEKINAQFPRTEVRSENGKFVLALRDPAVSGKLAVNNPVSDDSLAVKYLRDVFASTSLRKLFATCFDEELYLEAEDFFRRTVYHPLAKCTVVIAAAEVIKHIIISEGNQARSITDDLTEFAGSEFESTSDRRTERLIRMFLFCNKVLLLPGMVIRNPGKAIRKIMRKLRHK